MPHKFKVGDRVVIVRINAKDLEDDPDRGDRRVGKRSEVYMVESSGYWLNNGAWFHPEWDLEHEHIYDSPLYQALK